MRVKLDKPYERGGYSERVSKRKSPHPRVLVFFHIGGVKSRTVSSPRRPGQTAGRSYERHLRKSGDKCQSEQNADQRQRPENHSSRAADLARAAAKCIVQPTHAASPRDPQRRRKYARTDDERYEMRTFINTPVKPSDEDLGASARVRRPLHGCFRLRAERCKYWSLLISDHSRKWETSERFLFVSQK